MKILIEFIYDVIDDWDTYEFGFWVIVVLGIIIIIYFNI